MTLKRPTVISCMWSTATNTASYLIYGMCTRPTLLQHSTYSQYIWIEKTCQVLYVNQSKWSFFFFVCTGLTLDHIQHVNSRKLSFHKPKRNKPSWLTSKLCTEKKNNCCVIIVQTMLHHGRLVFTLFIIWRHLNLHISSCTSS